MIIISGLTLFLSALSLENLIPTIYCVIICICKVHVLVLDKVFQNFSPVFKE